MAHWEQGGWGESVITLDWHKLFMPDNDDQPDLSIDQFDLLLAEAIEKGLIRFDLTTKTFSRGPNFKCPQQDALPS